MKSLVLTFAIAVGLSFPTFAGAEDHIEAPKLNFLFAKGSTDDSGQAFSAIAWAGPKTKPGLSATLDGNVKCGGDFSYSNEENGVGVFKCVNGLNGTFRFAVSEDGIGSGRGQLFGVDPEESEYFSFKISPEPFE